MKKIYRISVFNRNTGKRELMYDTYTSRKAAQNIADAMNKLDPRGVIGAMVIVKEKK